jgi:L-rhamnose mutarotase
MGLGRGGSDSAPAPPPFLIIALSDDVEVKAAGVERVCFVLRVRPDRLDEYRARHREVWPEMLDALCETGWRNYSLFLAEDGLLVGYLETDDFAAALAGMAATDVNARWQAEMAPFFELPEDERPDTGLLRLAEVFHLD